MEKNQQTNTGLYPPVRFKLGRPPKYTPEEIREKFVEYVQWCRDNPIVLGKSTENISVEGIHYGSNEREEKPRLVSIGGFRVFLGVTSRWWAELDESKKHDFSSVKALIRDFCEEYQKEMASAGIFNGNIISRLLGLADKQQVETHGETRIIVESKEQADKINNIASLEG